MEIITKLIKLIDNKYVRTIVTIAVIAFLLILGISKCTDMKYTIKGDAIFSNVENKLNEMETAYQDTLRILQESANNLTDKTLRERYEVLRKKCNDMLHEIDSLQKRGKQIDTNDKEQLISFLDEFGNFADKNKNNAVRNDIIDVQEKQLAIYKTTSKNSEDKINQIQQELTKLKGDNKGLGNELKKALAEVKDLKFQRELLQKDSAENKREIKSLNIRIAELEKIINNFPKTTKTSIAIQGFKFQPTDKSKVPIRANRDGVTYSAGKIKNLKVSFMVVGEPNSQFRLKVVFFYPIKKEPYLEKKELLINGNLKDDGFPVAVEKYIDLSPEFKYIHGKYDVEIRYEDSKQGEYIDKLQFRAE